MPKPCSHPGQFDVQTRLTDLVNASRFILEIRIRCAVCNKQFQFVGLPEGQVNFDGACVSRGGLVAKLSVMPEGGYLPPLEDIFQPALDPADILPAFPEDGHLLPPTSGDEVTWEKPPHDPDDPLNLSGSMGIGGLIPDGET